MMTNETSEADYQNAATRWAVTWKLVRDLWPRWNPTDAQAAQWKQRLSWRYQVDVRAALEEVASERPFLTPRLGWVLAILKGKTPQHGSAERYEFSDEQIAEVVGDDQDMADDLMELPEEYLQEVLVEGFAAYLMIEIGVLGPEEYRRVRIHAQERAKDLPTDVRRWDTVLRGLVWAAWEHRRTGGSEAAQGRPSPGMPRETTQTRSQQASSTGVRSDAGNQDTSP